MIEHGNKISLLDPRHIRRSKSEILIISVTIFAEFLLVSAKIVTENSFLVADVGKKIHSSQ